MTEFIHGIPWEMVQWPVPHVSVSRRCLTPPPLDRISMLLHTVMNKVSLMNPNLIIPKERLADFCRANGIASLAVFGSALREDFRPDSDVDLLVEFQPGQTPGLHFVTIANELEMLFNRRVDLLTRVAVEQSQNPIRRRSILSTAELIYAA